MKNIENAKNKMKGFGEEIEDFYQHKEKNYCKHSDLLNMCKQLHPFMIFHLSLHGQCTEEFFIRINLKKKFAFLTYEDIDNGYQCTDKMSVVDENGNEVHQILHPLPIYKKFETLLYKELNKKYANDPDILNLKEISDKMSKIIENEGKGFSQEEIIAIIDRAIKTYSPGGPIWTRMPKNKGSQNK